MVIGCDSGSSISNNSCSYFLTLIDRYKDSSTWISRVSGLDEYREEGKGIFVDLSEGEERRSNVCEREGIGIERESENGSEIGRSNGRASGGEGKVNENLVDLERKRVRRGCRKEVKLWVDLLSSLRWEVLLSS